MFNNLSEEVKNRIRSALPVGQPEDVADIVAWLASHEARWVNGSVTNANDGAVFS